MDPTALLPSLTATPSTPAAGAAKPPEAGAEDFAALLLRAGQDPAKAAAPGMPASLLGELPGPTGLPATALPFAEDPPLPPAQATVLPATQVPLPTIEAGLPDPGLPGTPAGTDFDELDEPEAPADHATQEISLAIPAAMLPLPVPPPPPTMPGPSEQASATQAVDTAIPTGVHATTGENPAAEAKPSSATAPAEEKPNPAEALAVGLPGATGSEQQPASKAATALPAAASAQTSPTPLQTLPPAAAQPVPSVLREPAQAASRDPLKPQQSSLERPMAIAARIGQATAMEQETAAAVTSGQPSPMPERNSPAPVLATPMPQQPAEQAKAQPAPPDPLQAVPSGLSPPSLTLAAPDSAAPLATASAAPAAPPPPARQVAQVTIALAMGQGQAPRLTVALEPESLGRVEIRIERGAEGEAASVHVLAERPETLALLQRDARELDRTLAQAGVVVASGGTQFGLSSGNGGLPQEQRPQQQGGRQGGNLGGGQSGRTSLAVAGPAQATLNALSLLDIAV